jgi:hypothetical protein
VDLLDDGGGLARLLHDPGQLFRLQAAPPARDPSHNFTVNMEYKKYTQVEDGIGKPFNHAFSLKRRKIRIIEVNCLKKDLDSDFAAAIYLYEPHPPVTH